MSKYEKRRRLEYIRKKGFELDTHKEVWVKNGKSIESHLINHNYISFGAFKRIVDNIDKYGNVSNSFIKFSSGTRHSNETNKKTNKSVDALDYRLPGSYGTGKRR